jgi:hypothetical protein
MFITAAIGLKCWSRSFCWASTFFTAKKGKRGFTLHILEKDEGTVTKEEIR